VISKVEKHPLIDKTLIKIPYKDLDGKLFDWNKIKGKKLVLTFWATWCVPCIQELSILEK
jgi:thiol-disulfide isomerase/thioredoxin